MTSGWGYMVKNCFSNANLLNVFLNQAPNKQAPHNELFCKERYIFECKALDDIQNMPKLKSFSFVKRDNSFENYLSFVHNVSDRIALTRFRLSNHHLMIEKGRHQNMDICDRLCPFCPDLVENEFHFLIKCPTYRYQRIRLLDEINKVTIGFYYPPDKNFLFWFLMKNPTISNLTARFIRESLELRTFLLEHFRYNG